LWYYNFNGTPRAGEIVMAKAKRTKATKAKAAKPQMPSPSNKTDDPTQNLQSFGLIDLQQYTLEKVYSPTASKAFHLFFVGRDDVHDILKYVLSRVRASLYLNMFGFDDQELNDILMAKVMDPNVTMLITLDKSQAGGVHEKALLDADRQHALAAFNTHFAVGQSATHQISHTKGFVADGIVAGEGSVNWSASGEGTFIVLGQPGGAGYRAQNNTQTIFTDPDSVNRFEKELIAEHMTAENQQDATPPNRRQRKLTPAQLVAERNKK
jgi:hypothetical protein